MKNDAFIGIQEIYSPRLTDKILNFNTHSHNQSRQYLAEYYKKGKKTAG